MLLKLCTVNILLTFKQRDECLSLSSSLEENTQMVQQGISYAGLLRISSIDDIVKHFDECADYYLLLRINPKVVVLL